MREAGAGGRSASTGRGNRGAGGEGGGPGSLEASSSPPGAPPAPRVAEGELQHAPVATGRARGGGAGGPGEPEQGGEPERGGARGAVVHARHGDSTRRARQALVARSATFGAGCGTDRDGGETEGVRPRAARGGTAEGGGEKGRFEGPSRVEKRRGEEDRIPPVYKSHHRPRSVKPKPRLSLFSRPSPAEAVTAGGRSGDGRQEIRPGFPAGWRSLHSGLRRARTKGPNSLGLQQEAFPRQKAVRPPG